MFGEGFLNLLIAIIVGGFVILTRATSEEMECDPFEIGTDNDKFTKALASPIFDPGSCLCKSPCTESKVEEFVRFLYIKSGKTSYHRLNVENPKASRLYNYKGNLKFLFHGYTVQGTAGWMPPTGRQLSKVFNGYVILVDYGAISTCGFFKTAREIIPSVARYTASVIKDFNFEPRKIELIGHSLGAHLAGYIGASLNGAVNRITGLDPAGPGHDTANVGLNKSCAQFVQILHTEAGRSGTTLQRGDADFYASNKGVSQPGCEFEQCSHDKAVYYYYASLFANNKFIGGDCNFILKNASHTSIFGYYNDGKSGVFCFNTNPCYPYVCSKNK